MKAMLYLAALLPLSVMAQPINIDNNPNQPGVRGAQPAADAKSDADPANAAAKQS
ncbi:outer membrane protein [Klebsiella michiganensis]|uniref:Outer membrane protein n=1 Tax=Klebsiella michiganensis TaxID=1134687 RepID=A0A7H4PGC6_9ENTR|nr:outer membrane protein [Klebsiella michiganensis]